MSMPPRLAVAFVLILVVAGIRSANATEVNFVTDFGFNGRHAYFYVAREKGYYKAEGFDVNFVRGQGSADAIKKVAAGIATFGFADGSVIWGLAGVEGVRCLASDVWQPNLRVCRPKRCAV